MTYIKKNVVKSRGNAGAAAPKEPNVTIVAVDDILSWPPRDTNGVNHLGSFVMKPNAKMITFYMTPSSIKAPVEPTGDEDAEAFMHKFEGEAPGNDLNIAEAVQNWTGVNCIVIHGSCSDDFRKVQGTKCAPLKLKASLQDDKDARKWKLAFEAHVSTAYLPGHYTGALSFGVPMVIIDDVSQITVNSQTGGLVYQLPSLDTAAAIAIIWRSLTPGEVITLIGGGGVDPATLSDTVGAGLTSSILLTNGTPWFALKGAIISLRSFSGAITTFIEENRTA